MRKLVEGDLPRSRPWACGLPTDNPKCKSTDHRFRKIAHRREISVSWRRSEGGVEDLEWTPTSKQATDQRRGSRIALCSDFNTFFIEILQTICAKIAVELIRYTVHCSWIYGRLMFSGASCGRHQMRLPG